MPQIRMDEELLRRQLDQLPIALRVAFAAACAQRLLPCYARYCELKREGNPGALAEALDYLWAGLDGHPVTAERLNRDHDVCMSLVPPDDHQFHDQQACAEDATAAAVYAIEAQLTGDSQSALWAARRAYNAVDYHVMSDFPSGILPKSAEEEILSHPVVQAELHRQQQDMAMLKAAAVGRMSLSSAIKDVRARAQRDAARFLGSN
jgi:uncharacterized protein YjaG (DUF416 family)